MFRGNHPARVDEKGRLKLPADYKALLEGGPEAKQVFYITSRDGRRAEVYPIKAWEAVEAKLASIPSMNAARKKFLDVTNYYGQMTEMDAQGRVLLPQVLRDAAKVTAEVVVLGAQSYLEVANREMYEAELRANELTDEDKAVLGSLGI